MGMTFHIPDKQSTGWLKVAQFVERHIGWISIVVAILYTKWGCR